MDRSKTGWRCGLALALTLGASSAGAAPVTVCATTPDLADLARQVGGDRVEVTAFVAGPEDPHFVEARPGFVKALSKADLYIEVGLELESGWAPVVLQGARNARILPGTDGHLDASTAVKPLGAAEGPVSRALGDVHAGGNPHYLLDPMNGLAVAKAIAERLSRIDPAGKEVYAARLADFETRLGKALFGESLAGRYKGELEKLAYLGEHGALHDFLVKQGQDEDLGGWLGLLCAHHGARAVADHDLWPYFARRFGIEVIGFLEPKPGIAPTTRHLAGLIDRTRAEKIRVILASPYFNPDHARFVSEKTGAAVVELAHQVGGRPGTDDYLSFVDHNVRRLAAALGGVR